MEMVKPLYIVCIASIGGVVAINNIRTSITYICMCVYFLNDYIHWAYLVTEMFSPGRFPTLKKIMKSKIQK